MSELISYAFWEQIERRIGDFETSAEIAWFGIPETEVLVLAHTDVPKASIGDEAWRSLRRMGAIVTNPRYLYRSPLISTTTDAQGFSQPSLGVFVRKSTTRLSDGKVVQRSYQRPDQIHPVDLLAGASKRYLTFAYAALLPVLAHLDGASSSSWPWPGVALVRQRELTFAWMENPGIGSEFDPDVQGVWSPGRAGPHERILMGSGAVNPNQTSYWLVYAIGRFLLVEFWRDGDLITTRALDCKDVPREGSVRSEYVIGFGYDFDKGQVSLGVVRKDGPTAIAHETWVVPELIGFGFDEDKVSIGGGQVHYEGGHSGYYSSWGLVKPLMGMFASETPLTPGYMTRLAQAI